jgi:hypothetical protein
MLLSLKSRLNPFGPIIAPAIIKPRICGILNLLSRIGAKRIITSMTRNCSTGLVSGKASDETIWSVMIYFTVSKICKLDIIKNPLLALLIAGGYWKKRKEELCRCLQKWYLAEAKSWYSSFL